MKLALLPRALSHILHGFFYLFLSVPLLLELLEQEPLLSFKKAFFGHLPPGPGSGKALSVLPGMDEEMDEDVGAGRIPLMSEEGMAELVLLGMVLLGVGVWVGAQWAGRGPAPVGNRASITVCKQQPERQRKPRTRSPPPSQSSAALSSSIATSSLPSITESDLYALGEPEYEEHTVEAWLERVRRERPDEVALVFPVLEPDGSVAA